VAWFLHKVAWFLHKVYSLVPSQGSLVPSQGSLVPSQGSLVPSQGSLVHSQGSLVPSQGNLVPSQGSLVPRMYTEKQPGNLVQTVYGCNVMATVISHSNSEYWLVYMIPNDFPADTMCSWGNLAKPKPDMLISMSQYVWFTGCLATVCSL